MYISIANAQGQLLELVRRAESGEEVLLTHEGATVGQISARPVETKPSPWSRMTQAERRKVLDDLTATFPSRPEGEPDAAHSQDFLYDENGLPA
jgi:antitoxin (DNA-binding transcriptional repressor) of toxin-antitoxin stability system